MSLSNYEIKLSKASKCFCHLMGWAINHSDREDSTTYSITRIADGRYLGTFYKFNTTGKYGLVSSAFDIDKPFEYKGKGQVEGLRRLAQYITKMEKKHG